MNPETQELEQILKDFLAAIQQVIDSGEVLDDEFQGEIAKTLSLLWEKIEQSRSEESSVDGLKPSGPPQLEPGPFESSNVNSFKYDPDNQQLFVKFHGKDTADSGPTYSYQGIPEHIFDIFRRGGVAPLTSGSNKYHTWHKGVTPSLGASMNQLIKAGNYPYAKIS